VWTNELGDKVEYRSSEYARLNGIEVNIVRGKATLKVSVHKFWNNRTRGVLRNDNVFTISEAKSAFRMLLSENGFLPEKTRINQFEIGLNLKVKYDPITYIELARSINSKEKIMFVDANFRINRQKTSEKHQDMRKYYKIYDKGWEMQEKRRKNRIEREEKDRYALRIETVYRRHDERLDTFLTDANISRIVARFYADWSGIFFSRTIDAHKGVKKSEIERALMVINEGADEYMKRVRKEHEDGLMTDKQYRTIREFVRDFEITKKRFKTVVSKQENEYKRLLRSTYKSCLK
jgi:hypothetical protein